MPGLVAPAGGSQRHQWPGRRTFNRWDLSCFQNRGDIRLRNESARRSRQRMRWRKVRRELRNPNRRQVIRRSSLADQKHRRPHQLSVVIGRRRRRHEKQITRAEDRQNEQNGEYFDVSQHSQIVIQTCIFHDLQVCLPTPRVLTKPVFHLDPYSSAIAITDLDESLCSPFVSGCVRLN